MRETSIDVLRGLAIAGMVLSGTISRNADLPAWLFHAQIPPPDFTFNGLLPGITWVDLVFPFFLFAMGMAFPFSLGRMADQGVSSRKIISKTIARSMKLLFFAIMLGHLSPFHYPQEMGWPAYLMALLAFAGFFMAFSRFPAFSNYENKINLAGYALLIIIAVIRVYGFDLTFSLHNNDIIILVLANMALFGALIWYFTRNNWYLRLGIMAIYFAIRLTHGIEGSWNKMLWDFTPLKWVGSHFPVLYESLLGWGIDLKRTIFYNPEFLKYLMIVIPGTIAGDILFRKKGSSEPKKVSVTTPGTWLLTAILGGAIAFNLWGLQSRNLDVVWVVNLAVVGFIVWYKNKKLNTVGSKNTNLLMWSAFWLILGLVFEAWQGGIKKDSATISYFFLTSGLAGFSIVLFRLHQSLFETGKALSFNTIAGMNPMLAYVVVNYCIIPILYFVRILPWMDQWHTHWPWAGVLRGVLLTTLMFVATWWSVKKKLYWKT